MSALLAVSGLGIVCLLLEICNLRRILVSVTIVALSGIVGMTMVELCMGESLLGTDQYNMVVSSGFTQAFTILFILLTILIVAMDPTFYKEKIVKIADYVALKVFILAGAIAMVSFGNLAMFFIGLEVLSIAAYVLAASEPKSIGSNEAGAKYFIMGAFASSFILFGIALVYGATGSFDIATITTSSLAQGETLPIWFKLGFLMITVGMLFKASIVPFHFWAPDVYEGSPTLVTALMSTLIKVVAIASLYKVMSIMVAGITPAYQVIIMVLSILSMTVGNITALAQSNIKRMMAFSGISHAGFMITVGMSANTVLYYAAAYAFAGIAAFSVILSVCQGKDNEEISNFHGLARRKPILAILLTGALLSLGGIPLFSGFFAKFFVFDQMLQSKYPLLIIFAILNSIVAVYYYFKVVNVMFTKESESDEPINAPREYVVAGVIALTLNLVLGIFPSIVMGLKL